MTKLCSDADFKFNLQNFQVFYTGEGHRIVNSIRFTYA